MTIVVLLSLCSGAQSSTVPHVPIPTSVTNVGRAPVGSRATTQTTGAFTLLTAPEHYGDVTLGPDGNFWYVAGSQLTEIVRFTPAGVATTFKLPKIQGSPVQATSTAVGTDGKIWFGTYSCLIGSITPSGAIHLYSVPEPPMSSCIITVSIATASTGMWFTNQISGEGTGYSVGYITSNGTTSQFSLPAGYQLTSGLPQVTEGPDCNMWFTAENYIGQVTPNGSTMNFFAAAPLTYATSIIAGPDGNLWFIGDPISSPSGGVGKMNTSGQMLAEYNAGGGNYGGGYFLTTGADGNVWVTATNTLTGIGGVARITPAGVVTQFALPKEDRIIIPCGITVGSNSNIWFSTYGRGGLKESKGIGTFVLQ